MGGEKHLNFGKDPEERILSNTQREDSSGEEGRLFPVKKKTNPS